MNEKYTHNILGSVFKDGELFALTQGEAQATKLCIELNTLHEECLQYLNIIGDIRVYAKENDIENILKIINKLEMGLIENV